MLLSALLLYVPVTQPSVWKAWEGLEEGAKLGELVVRTVKRKKPDGSVVEEQTMQVKPGVSVSSFFLNCVFLQSPPSCRMPRLMALKHVVLVTSVYLSRLGRRAGREDDGGVHNSTPNRDLVKKPQTECL